LLTEEKSIAEGRFASTVSTDGSEVIDEHDSQRHDWGQLPVYVIDAEDAEELDDGISIEKLNDGTNWIHVHVADPTSQLSRGNTIALVAAARACTMYGPQRTFPMLPTGHSVTRHSLGVLDRDKGQKVLTFSAHLDGNGNLVESTVRTGVVRNVHVITYAAVEEAWGEPSHDLHWPFEEGPRLMQTPGIVPPEAHPDLEALRSLGLIQQRRKATLGRMSWTMPQPKVYFPDKPVPTSSKSLELWAGYPRLAYGVERRELSPARAMVAEAMILAGKVAGQFCTEKGLPGLFRAAGKPLGAPVDPNSRGNLPAEMVMRSQIASRPAYYSTSPSDHWQLGIDAENGGYVRVTSPLRRFADMVMHWQIKAALSGKQVPSISSEEMQKYAARLHERETTVSAIYKAQQGYWAAVFIQRRLESHPDEPLFRELAGYAFAAAEFDTFSRLYNTTVFVPELGVKGWLSTTNKPGWDTGDQINVRITGVTMVGKAKIRLGLNA
jgi:exoribonuclease II